MEQQLTLRLVSQVFDSAVDRDAVASELVEAVEFEALVPLSLFLGTQLLPLPRCRPPALPCNTHTSIPTGHLYTPSPATPTPASLQVTSIPPPLQHPHQHPYRSPLYPLPCNTHTSIPTGHLYTSLQHPHQHPYRSPLYPLPCNTHTSIPTGHLYTPSPATPTPASLQVTSIPPCNTHTSIPTGHLYTSLQHPHQHPYRSPLY